MKKTFTKFASLALALAMMLSLSITAFATADTVNETITVNLDVTASGVDMIGGPFAVTVDKGASVYTALNQLNVNEPDLALAPHWTPVPEVDKDGKPTGVICQALDSLMGFSEVAASANERPTYIEEDGVKHTVQYWSDSMPGYGLVYSETSADETTYHYVYAGYDWMYSVNGVEPEVYMDQYVLQNGDEVTLDYNLQVTTWTSNEYIF